MPHDRNGDLIEVGKIVNIPCRVKSITMDENYCNLTVETLYPMPPYETCASYTLNTKQVELKK